MDKTYIIAEAGVNHNGSLDMALELVDAAVFAGADAIKFQTFNTEMLVDEKTEKADYQKKRTDSNESQFDMLKGLELSRESFQCIFSYCREREIEFLSTPFDLVSLNMLIDLFSLDTIKISSGDLTNAPFLLEIAKRNRSIILSTGMSTIEEIEMALSVLAFGYVNKEKKPLLEDFLRAYHSTEGQQALKKNVTLLHCTTDYPTLPIDVNLCAMDTLRSTFGLKVGYSDHTSGVSVAIAAVARGACIIEKHFTLDKNLPGPDHVASLEPNELKVMISSVREIEMALGSKEKKPTTSEARNALVARKSIIANCGITKGEKLTNENVAIKRPGNGISPIYYWKIIGSKASRNYNKGDLINELY